MTTQNTIPLPETEIPNAARIYDYTLEGTFNVETDRQAAEYMFHLVPSTRKWVKLLRSFLQEVARELYAEGFTQFLDLGSGLPTTDHIHTVVPKARVIYCDNDPLTVEYGQALLKDVPNAHYILGDLTNPAEILDSPVVKSVIDPSQKVAIGLNAVLTHLRWNEIKSLAETLYGWAPDGSKIYETVETKEIGKTTPQFQQFLAIFQQAGSPMYMMSLEENMEVMRPWHFIRIEPVADYLERDRNYITEADREGVGLEFYAALLGKYGSGR
ncbi:MAG: SAM-dependent methyltransferase [Ardenticatenales bacterium]|nr:SAM-dependent methyltransferase [Ardenticatenales bacterium]